MSAIRCIQVLLTQGTIFFPFGLNFLTGKPIRVINFEDTVSQGVLLEVLDYIVTILF